MRGSEKQAMQIYMSVKRSGRLCQTLPPLLESFSVAGKASTSRELLESTPAMGKGSSSRVALETYPLVGKGSSSWLLSTRRDLLYHNGMRGSAVAVLGLEIS